MKTAQELYEVSKRKAPEIVDNILEGTREHTIKRCEEEASKGSTYYTLRLKSGLCFVRDLLLEKSIKMAQEFEDNGYKISICDYGNGYYAKFSITFSWDDNILLDEDRRCLYNTNNGILKDVHDGRSN